MKLDGEMIAQAGGDLAVSVTAIDNKGPCSGSALLSADSGSESRARAS